MRDRLLRRIEGVLVASRWSLLEYNCPGTRIDEAMKITPGYSSPTIQKTDSGEWMAVKVMVEIDQVQGVMDQLEAIGCRAIIETDVVHCRL
jgi:ATP phosphoribosyltransferase